MTQRRIEKRLTDRARELRNNPTPQEYKIWQLLSRYRPKFTRQLSIKPYTADLACRQAKLIVESTVASISIRKMIQFAPVLSKR